jgi:hypothetical protein
MNEATKVKMAWVSGSQSAGSVILQFSLVSGGLERNTNVGAWWCIEICFCQNLSLFLYLIWNYVLSLGASGTLNAGYIVVMLTLTFYHQSKIQCQNLTAM